MDSKYLSRIKELGFQWETNNPFLFCVHHLDHYPRGNEDMGPAKSLAGRNIGQDFSQKDGWRMYHGERIPGFPVHPHRGFETITVVLNGFVDHADSMGASGRYGNGDVQWMTAGAGMQHAEMFPLINSADDNPLELFQIWLNLPAKSKFVKPYYQMLWSENIPKLVQKDDAGKSAEINVIAGSVGNVMAPEPNPDSWAAPGSNEVAIWLITLIKSGASWEIPPASGEATRSLYYYQGDQIRVDEQEISSYKSVDLHADQQILIENGLGESRILLLQGRPIEEPVVQYGPFVMNSEDEIKQAFADYRKTEFGGWPWPDPDPVSSRNSGRFARQPDGTIDRR